MTVGLLSLAGALPAINNNRVTINANAYYINLAKGFSFPSQDPTTVSANGYPLSTPASSITGNPGMPANYYGTFTWSFIGKGSMQNASAPPMVLTSGGSFLVGSPTVDTAPGNQTLLSQTNPTVVFAFGWNIQSISSGSGGVITINTKTNYVASGAGYVITNSTVNITGANANTGANGTWTVTNLTASSFDLVGSTFTNAQAGAAGQAIFAAGNLSITFLNSGTYGSGGTQMANLIWARTGDIAAITAGQIIDATYISQLKFLFNQTGGNNSSRGWLRFMDLSGVQTSFESDFSQRIPATNVNYTQRSYRSGYWAGTITNTADAFTCSDPSVSTWNGSSYIDNAIVQGIPSATNTGGLPTLNVGGNGAKPVFNYSDSSPPFAIKVTSGAASSGLTLQFTFTQAAWTNPQLNGGSAYVFSYVTVAGDTVAQTLQNNLITALSADATLSAAKIFFANRQNGYGPFILPRTAQAGRLSLTYSSGPAIISIYNCKPSAIAGGATIASGGTFIYNYLLDGWIYLSGAMVVSVPFEAVVDMCNRAGAHCWFNMGFTKGAWVTAVTQFFGDSVTGLTSGLRLGLEVWNEVWNPGANPYSNLVTQGQALGWSESSGVAPFSLTSLRVIQYSALAKGAWTGKGRSASDYYVLQPTQGSNINVGGNFDASSLAGVSLVTTNVTYATYGGLNGGTSPSYNAAPTRPVDITNAIGYAPYWDSHWAGSGSFTQASNSFAGTVAQNSDLLQAALNFANGLVSTAFTTLPQLFNGGIIKSGGSTGAIDLSSTGEQTIMTAMETLCANYDGAGRVTAGLPALGVLHYEGGPSFGIGANGNNGVNSPTFNTVAAGDITALANQMTTGLSWGSVAAYTFSGTDNKTEMATMVLQMLQAWKYDVDNNGNAFNSGSYKNLIKTSYYQALKTTSGANRETKPCQYGYAASNWGMWPVSPFDTTPYQNYNAINEWNVGS
jgi:hypothetical protein